MRTVETAQRAFAAWSEETRGFVSAYVEGQQRAACTRTAPELAALRDRAPGTWEPWTPLAVFLAQHLLFANIAGQLWQRAAPTCSATTWRCPLAPGP